MKQFMKLIKIASFAACALLGLTANAAEWTYNNQKITYTGSAEKIDVAGSTDLVLKFTSSGTLELPGVATANILVVGGGASGNSGKNNQVGAGGNGGDVVEQETQSLSKGTYQITVGGAGSNSKIEGPGKTVQANGATSKNSNDGSGAGVYEWTCSEVMYGKGGVSGSGKPGANNTGEGGGGGTKSWGTGGSGGSGVVFVRITSLKQSVVDEVAKEVFVGNSLSFTDAVWGDSWTCSSANTGIAKATKPESGTDLVVKGVTAGQTTISVENATTVYTYTIKVNAKPEVTKDTVTLQVGDTTDPISDAAWGSGWTVLSDRTSIATVATSGSDAFVVTGKAVGTANVRVTTDDTIYVYPIVVTRKQETVDYLGDTITYSGAEVAWVGTDLVFTFNDLEGGNLNLPTGYKADVLVVGGGAGGVKGKSGGSKYTGNGGNGGRVTAATEVQMPTGVYSIQVGVGGAGVSTGTQDFIAGGAGSASSIGGVTGFETLTAQGGEAGVTRDNTNAGVLVGSGTKDSDGKPSADGESAANGTSAITGTSYTYGKGGSGVKENCASEIDGAAGDEYGEGGGGSANGGASGAGYQGVVIVRLKPNLPVEELTIETYPGRSKTLSFDGNISSVKTQDENIAQVAKDGANNTVTITGVAEGETFVTVVTSDKIYKYTVKVGSGQVINKKVVLAKGGNGTQTTYTQTFEVIEGTLPSTADPAIAGVAWSTDGKTMTVTPVGKGTTQLTVEGVADDIPTTYNFTIEVEEFENSVAPFGESFIAYTGAETKTVGDDLVLIFNETGSFTVPSPYTATMNVLAVGGGGAGGSAPTFGIGAAGGGAGGFTEESLNLMGGTYEVVVGKGGTNPDGLTSPLRGLNGEPSAIKDYNDHDYISAAGGGGGGAPSAEENDGFPGGSGGGAAWYLPGGAVQPLSGKAGAGTGAQGWQGSVSSVEGDGGGGGGAGGRGGARPGDTTGTSGGPGLESSIDGVSYAKGGNGAVYGKRTDVSDLNGENPGDGGDGGNGTKGGNGADGIVIVRISKLAQNILVPVPTEADILALRHEWVKDETYDGLKDGWENMEFRSISNGETYKWGDVVYDIYPKVRGVKCSEAEDGTKEGVGYYNFTISLRSGFAWVDSGAVSNPYGLEEPKSFRWSIVEDLENVDADLRITKEVSATDGPNAIVTVNTFSSPEMTGKSELKILFLGGLCSSHGLVGETISRSLNAIAEKGSVHYFLFSQSNQTPVSETEGTLPKGERLPLNNFTDLTTGRHSTATAFYTRLYKELVEKKQEYDYIVFEFDGSRSAQDYTTYEFESAVADALKDYYASNRVIWIVDDPNAEQAGTYQPNEVWGIDNGYWRPNSYYCRSHNGHQNLSDVEYRGLIGLFDPAKYDVNGTRAGMSLETVVRDGVTYYANTRNDLQANYNNPEDVVLLLQRAIKAKPYNLHFEDKIAAGLSVKTVTILVCTNGTAGVASQAAADWHKIMTWDATNGSVTKYSVESIPTADMAVDADNNVTAEFYNIDFPVWTKVDIGVLDDGTFRTNVGDGDYNPQTGKYEKNPNDGPAHAYLMSYVGEEEQPLGVEGYADTQIPWSFTTVTVTGTAVNGKITVGSADFAATDSILVAPGSTVNARFIADPGYKLKVLKVDGVLVEPDESGMMYTLKDIQRDTEIYVEYESYMEDLEVVSHPVTHVYDGEGLLIEVDPIEGWNTDDYEIRYSLERESPSAAWLAGEEFLANEAVKNVIKNVKVETKTEDGETIEEIIGHEIYFRIFVKQAGYGDEFVDTGVTYSNTSTVLPRPIVVKPSNYHVIYVNDPKPGDIGYGSDGFVGGDTLSSLGVETKDWWVDTEYAPVDGHNGIGEHATWVVGPVDGQRYGNYIVTCQPFVLYVEKWPIWIGWKDHNPSTGIPRVQQYTGLDPETMDTGVDKVVADYDGQPHSLTVEVTGPKGDELWTLIDGEKSFIPQAPWYTNPAWTDYTLEYCVEDIETHEKTQWTTTNPKFTDAGTYKVWYRVTPKNVEGRAVQAGSVYLSAENYNYVVINPIEITVESATGTHVYDKSVYSKTEASMIKGELFEGDTLGYVDSAWGSRQNVGTSKNTFEVKITRNGEDVTKNYKVTKIEGDLTVTPAPIKINGKEQRKDGGRIPHNSNPDEYGVPADGVKDVKVYYFNDYVNIDVNVELPPLEDSSNDKYTILYTTEVDENGEPVDTSWKTAEEFPGFKDAGTYTVWYKIETTVDDESGSLILDDEGEPIHNYWTVVNCATVTILPREVEVKADDKVKAKDTPDPVFTAQILSVAEASEEHPYSDHPEGFLPGDDERIVYTKPITRAEGEDVGEYAITPTGDELQFNKNYHVTYVPGTLTIVDAAKIISLWITDHADAGSGYVHLAFKPTVNVSDMTRSFFTTLANNGGIRVVYGKTEADLEKAKPEVVSLRKDWDSDFDEKGWVWVTVPVPTGITAEGLVWKIDIQP